mgnify:CR=1 FL=1
MENEDKVKGIKIKLKELDDNVSRIGFLENYLKRSDEIIEPGVLASIYELLGELHYSTGNPKGSYFQKAALTWETVFVLSHNDKEIISLKNALKNYQKALKIYKKKDNFALANEITNRMEEVKGQLYKHIGPIKKLTVGGVFILFILSFVFLSSSFTGFSVAPLEASDSASVGGVFVILAIMGMFLVYKWVRV